jgi:hypothetical protein
MTRPTVLGSLLAGPTSDRSAPISRHRPSRSGALGFAALLLAGCASAGAHDTVVRPSPVPERPIDALMIPGTYATAASCGQEGGDEVFLTILPSHVFSMRQAYRDKACNHLVSVVYLGGWVVSEDGKRLKLDAGPPWLRVLAIIDAHTLRAPTPGRDEPGLFRAEDDPRPIHLVELHPPFRPFGPTLLH